MMNSFLDMAFKNLKMNNYLLAKAKCIFFYSLRLKLEEFMNCHRLQPLDNKIEMKLALAKI